MLLYYSFVCILLALTSPFLLLAAKRRAGIWQKLGLVPGDLPGRLEGKQRTVWFHAVSVGEFNAVWPLIQRFSEQHASCRIVISTSTRTGQNLARERAGDKATVIYFPLDVPWAINNWLDALHPDLVVIVETEIWPGFTYECTRRGIQLLVVNGRISPRSSRSYYRWRAFFGPVIRRFRIVVAQSEADADRYKAIAGDSLKLEVSGNLKFDGLKPVSAGDAANLRESLGIKPDDLVIVAGSTHDGEESALLDALDQLHGKQESGATVRLVIAPRHPERWQAVESLIESRGYRARLCTRNERFETDRDVYLLDTIGQLFRYYSLAAVAFVGGTLVPIGGHSLVEPCAYGVPVVSGPHVEKTQDSANGLKGAGALTVVPSGGELAESLNKLLADEKLRNKVGESGRRWLERSQGAIARTLDVLNEVLTRQYNDPRPESGHNHEVLTKQ